MYVVNRKPPLGAPFLLEVLGDSGSLGCGRKEKDLSQQRGPTMSSLCYDNRTHKLTN